MVLGLKSDQILNNISTFEFLQIEIDLMTYVYASCQDVNILEPKGKAWLQSQKEPGMIIISCLNIESMLKQLLFQCCVPAGLVLTIIQFAPQWSILQNQLPVGKVK